MNPRDIFYQSKMVCPVLFMPNRCATLLTPCDVSDDIFLNLKISVIDIDDHEARLFKGLCNVKFITDNAQNLRPPPTLTTDLEITQMEALTKKPDMSSPKDHKVRTDPNRNPDLNSNYNTNVSKRKYSVDKENKSIPFKQYKQKNVRKNYSEPFDEVKMKLKKYKSDNKVSDQNNSPLQDNLNKTNALEREIISSQPVGEVNERKSKDAEVSASMEMETENFALKQLMSTDKHLPNKQQKTILLIGHRNQDGKTIQKISVNHPLVKCIPGAATDCEAGVETEENPLKKEYQCDKCKQIFDQLTTFKQHMVIHWIKAAECRSDRDGLFTCSKCGKKIKTREKFERHCYGHGDPELECDKCFKVFASKFTLRIHRKIHMRKYSCKRCTKKFSTSLELKAHAAKVHSEYNCDTCEYTASDNRDLEAHQSSHEANASGVRELKIASDITIGNRSPEYSPPPRANEEMEASEDNDWEDENKTDADAVISKVISNEMFLLNSKAAKKQKKYNKKCEVCSKSFDRIGDLKRHLIEHIVTITLSKNPVDENGSLSIRCQVCRAKVFNKTDKYKEHLREHAKLTLYQCTSCNKSFSDSSNFSKHKKIHGSRYFQCDLCQRKFNSKKMIMLHMDYHNKNAPLVCSYCDKKFYFKSMLNKHIKYTHAKDTSTRFRCQFCHGYYKTLKEKWDHEWQVHKVRKNIADCYVCDSKFRKYSELKRHCSVWHNLNIPSANK